MEILNDYPDVVNPQALIKILGIGKNKAYELLQKQKIHSIRIGTNYKIPKCNIIAYLLGSN